MLSRIFIVISFLCILGSAFYAQAQTSSLQWQVMGDLSARYEHTETSEPSFMLGNIDLWFQSEFSERWAGLGEIMIMNMSKEGDPSYMVHPARLFLSYMWSDALQIRAGEMHTPINLYSQLYPHGARFFEPTIHRPHLARVAVHEELLPLHTVGINARGTFTFGESLDLMYIVGVGNGDAHGGIDSNLFKSPYAQIRLSPLAIEGLTFALSGYLDKIESLEYVQEGALHQLITNVSVHYDFYPIELLLETFWVKHAKNFGRIFGTEEKSSPNDLDGEAETTSLLGTYLQILYHLGDHSLFSLVEVYKRDKNDALFNEHTPYEEYWGISAGYRYFINQNLLLKAGHSYNWVDNLHRFDLQLAYRL